MSINLKFVTTFVVIAALMAFFVYFGRVYEGFTDSTMPSSDDPSADSITPGSMAPPKSGSYNHFTKKTDQTLSGTYYSQNPKEGSITIVDQDTLQLNLPNGESITLNKQQENKEGFTTAAYGTFVVYVASNGAKATIVSGSDGQSVIRLRKANGEVVYYYLNGAPSSTGTTSDSATSETTSSTATSSTSSSSSTNPTTAPSSTSSGSYSTYPAPTTYNTYSPPNDYTSALPAGIPRYMIPPGQEDLYILKTEVVPPVCPKCPNCKIINNRNSGGDCPKCRCPAPQPCPQDQFECKKVPNYNAINNSSLPVPVINDFSTFGM